VSRNHLEEAKRAWGLGYEGLSQEEIDQKVLAFTAIVRGIAMNGAVSATEFSRARGLDAGQASEIFTDLAIAGLEGADEKRIVGAALTVNPTPHRVRFESKQLYAWCALDTLFIPGFVGSMATVESRCPTSDASIRLTVTPERVETVDPIGTVISVVLPGAGGTGLTIGPASPT